MEKNRVQLFNPIDKYWIKMNTETGSVIGHKKTPYKNVRKCNRWDLFEHD